MQNNLQDTHLLTGLTLETSINTVHTQFPFCISLFSKVFHFSIHSSMVGYEVCVCLSVCPSVRPSIKLKSPYNILFIKNIYISSGLCIPQKTPQRIAKQVDSSNSSTFSTKITFSVQAELSMMLTVCSIWTIYQRGE